MAFTQGASLVGRHLLPALEVAHDALLLLGRQRLELSLALQDALAALGGQALEAIVRVLQLLTPLRAELVPSLEIFEDSSLLLRWKRAEALHALARGLTLLGGERSPVTVVLQHALAFVGVEPPVDPAARSAAITIDVPPTTASARPRASVAMRTHPSSVGARRSRLRITSRSSSRSSCSTT